MGIIDTKITDYRIAVEQADVLIFATPVQQTIRYLAQLHLFNTQANLIVTDTGSTKTNVLEFENRLLHHNIHLVGGHPMAGSHKSGVLNAKSIYLKMHITFSFIIQLKSRCCSIFETII